MFVLIRVSCYFFRSCHEMKTRKLVSRLLCCCLVALLLLCIGGIQGRRASQSKAKLSPAHLLKESFDSIISTSASASLEQLEENIVSWTGVQIPKRKVSSAQPTQSGKGQKSRRHKTKSGLLIESNIAEDQLTASAEFGARATPAGKKQSQRRRNGRLQRPNGKSSSANNGKFPLWPEMPLMRAY